METTTEEPIKRRTKSFTCDAELAAELDRIVREEDVIGSRIIERALREFLVRTRPHRFPTSADNPLASDPTQPS